MFDAVLILFTVGVPIAVMELLVFRPERREHRAGRRVIVLPLLDVEHLEAIDALWADIKAMPDGPDRDTLERCIGPHRPLVGGSPAPGRATFATAGQPTAEERATAVALARHLNTRRTT